MTTNEVAKLIDFITESGLRPELRPGPGKVWLIVLTANRSGGGVYDLDDDGKPRPMVLKAALDALLDEWDEATFLTAEHGSGT